MNYRAAVAGTSRSIVSTLANFTLLFLARAPFALVGGLFFLALFLIFSHPSWTEKAVVAAEEDRTVSSAITEKFSYQTSNIPFPKEEVPENSLGVGERKVVRKGLDGSLQTKIRTLFFQGKEFTKEIVETKTFPPTSEITAFGTRKTYNELNLNGQIIHYWQKLSMFSTSYDSTCKGCDGRTAIGLKTGYGVVAVDPKVIPLRTKLYIPGYGFAVAGDTGGSIKGNRIDLGFDDVKHGWWSSRWTDVYLLSE